jgi:hypothetical protein
MKCAENRGGGIAAYGSSALRKTRHAAGPKKRSIIAEKRAFELPSMSEANHPVGCCVDGRRGPSRHDVPVLPAGIARQNHAPRD